MDDNGELEKESLADDYNRISIYYSLNIDEIIRQVTVGCIEQGLLLFEARNEILMTIDYYRKAYESGVEFGLRKAIKAELELNQSRAQVS